MKTAMLGYTTVGSADKPPVVFLHGLLGAGDEWDEQTRSLGDSRYCVRIDLPGHGKSRDCALDLYPMPACAEAVIELLDSLEISTAGLCGYSMGGRLACYLATHFGERFDRVLIESASPGLRSEQERTERTAHDEELALRLERDGIGPFLVHWYRQPLFASLTRNPELVRSVTARRLDNNPRSAARSLRFMGTGTMPDLRPRLSKLDIPMMLVTGELDVKFTSLAGEIADLCPTATHRILKDCGHNVHLERPHEFLEVLKEFFQ